MCVIYFFFSNKFIGLELSYGAGTFRNVLPEIHISLFQKIAATGVGSILVISSSGSFHEPLPSFREEIVVGM
jgi:hypothetical protein